MNKPAYHFMPKDVESALLVLNAAINNHRLWFESLHTSILCGQAFRKDILSAAAHQQCDFGKWYYGEVNESIKTVREFSELESVHKNMHDQARTLAQLSTDNKIIAVDVYQQFLSTQHHLIDLLTGLRDVLIAHQHSFDALTGAVNRRSVSLLLEQSFANAQRYSHIYSVAMIDVDKFKKINDQYGHIAGDQVLKKIAMFFRKSLRKSDCIGRYGGEEFIVLLPQTSKQQAYELMEKDRCGLSNEKIIIGDDTVTVTVSIGVAELMPDDVDAWQAVKRADVALYRAKDAGRNRVKIAE